MRVRLVALTQSLVPSAPSPGDFIAYAARVSNPGNQQSTETAPRLLKYLRSNGHWSPFEMAHAVMEIRTTRDIARQILRHRSFSFQEFSQRYAEATEFELSEARRQDDKNRQNSIDDLSEDDRSWWVALQRDVQEGTSRAYQQAIKRGIAKECARKILPEGLTVSVLYMSGSVRSWIHYLEQRTHPSTQLEHREVALAIQAELADHFPQVFSKES